MQDLDAMLAVRNLLPRSESLQHSEWRVLEVTKTISPVYTENYLEDNLDNFTDWKQKTITCLSENLA